MPITLTSRTRSGSLHIVFDADDGGQVEDRVDTGSQGFFQRAQIGDVALHEPEVGMPVEVDAGVAGVLGEVEHRDRVAAVQQCGDQVRPDQAVAARHDDIRHIRSFVSMYGFTFACRTGYRPIPL